MNNLWKKQSSGSDIVGCNRALVIGSVSGSIRGTGIAKVNNRPLATVLVDGGRLSANGSHNLLFPLILISYGVFFFNSKYENLYKGMTVITLLIE